MPPHYDTLWVKASQLPESVRLEWLLGNSLPKTIEEIPYSVRRFLWPKDRAKRLIGIGRKDVGGIDPLFIFKTVTKQ